MIEIESRSMLDLYIKEVMAGQNFKLEKERLEKYIKRLEEQVCTDPLTGVYNRLFLEEKGEALVAEYLKSGKPLHAIIVDGDRFKSINDTYGHKVGDDVIKHIAEALLISTRSGDDRRQMERGENGRRKSDVLYGDFVARLGGDEFVVILPECDEENARECVKRIKTRLELDPFMNGEAEIAVTVSCGVARLTNESDLTELLSKADTALYETKDNGKNGYNYIA
jgi:two-component system, cell cycle response regulator